ncbi:MAG: bifunctional (p)ppGpp synthetase/guanosine-3',5'-bis(diphosphate) 3'-pyrophosphohydrolase [Chloroflexi bacterium]|nr:bifunctional (p)ppGpp synthetase/guanosine-3',5'-bis(diphosphate) 3'-pyrophosphohydrolase [Chloroflexota bacterium]
MASPSSYSSYALASTVRHLVSLDDLLSKVQDYLAPDKTDLIGQAYAFAEASHRGQLRKSGEPYIQHPLHTAILVADLRLDVDTIVSALLHDVPEDCGVSFEEVERRFGPEVRKLVDGVTKLSKLAAPATDSARPRSRAERTSATIRAENLRKMLLAMAEDIRVVLIKLADRLHNMRTLWAMPPEKRRETAGETMEVYAPLAHRLGIWQWKWELEDLSFRYLQPEKYREISQLVATQRAAREQYIEQVIPVLQTELQKVGIHAEVTGRPKHLYSIFTKIEKYRTQGKDFGQIYDLLALRVLVDTVQDCYSALGVVHQLWHPLPGQFDDYIANPKGNGYQSLHTAVMCLGGQPLEIQIRTHEMHRIAEYGVAAHWRYKEGASRPVEFDAKLAWLRQLLEWQREVQGAEEFVESVKTDLFHDQVFVYTPRGDIKDLPAGATPLDFAYRIHTDLGHRCIGAKVNGRLVPLNTPLRTGDVVEILTGKSSRGPSRDWLNPSLGYLKTAHAREKARQWFRRQEREENLAKGRELLDKEIKRLGIAQTEDEIARLFKYDTVEEMLLAIAYGDLSPSTIAMRLAAQQEQPVVTRSLTGQQVSPASVRVLGVGDLLTNIARCCHPVPGDEITGYVTRTRGVTVHRRDCYNIVHADEPERLIPVDWGPMGQLYAVPIRLVAWDRVGLLRDLSTVIAAEGVNMAQVSHVSMPDGTASLSFVLETTGIVQLSRLLARLEAVPSVLSVVRVSESAGKTLSP